MASTTYNDLDLTTESIPEWRTATFANHFNNTLSWNLSHVFNHSALNKTESSGILQSELDDLCRLQFCTGIQTYVTEFCAEKFPAILAEVRWDAILSEPVSYASRVILTMLFSIIIFVAVIGNILVMLTFIVNKHMRSVTNVFILSLAISDLLVIVVIAPMNMATVLNTFWISSSFACNLLPFLMTFVVACSSLTLCCIAFDRYYAIVHPLRLKFLQTATRACFLQCIVWVVSIWVSVPCSFFYDLVDQAACKVNDEESKMLCLAVGHEDLVAAYDTWVRPILLLLVPFLFMFGMYAVICHKLWIQRPIGARISYEGRLRLKKKAIKMLITVVMMFVFCWSPILCFNGVAMKYDLKITHETITLRAYLQCLGLSSCCWNPIVYAFMNERFRKAFTTLLICRKKNVYPILKGKNDPPMLSTGSRKTTTQLEMPGPGTRETSETKC